MSTALDTINASGSGRQVYAALIGLLDSVGPYQVDAEPSALHITHGPAFLDVRPRPDGLLLSIVTSAPLAGDRIRRSEQVSANRWHNEVVVPDPDEVDDEVAAWIGAAYTLTG